MELYIKELKALAQKFQADIQERNREIDEGCFRPPTIPRSADHPCHRSRPPYLNFAPLDNAPAYWPAHGRVSQSADKITQNGGSALSSASLTDVIIVDRKRTKAHQRGRAAKPPWFKHQIYAPGFYTDMLRKPCGCSRGIDRNNEAGG